MFGGSGTKIGGGDVNGSDNCSGAGLSDDFSKSDKATDEKSDGRDENEGFRRRT